jgi:hypothetical protein
MDLRIFPSLGFGYLKTTFRNIGVKALSVQTRNLKAVMEWRKEYTSELFR